MKIRSQHSDDGHGLLVQLHGLADYVGIAGILVLPECTAQHHGVRSVDCIFLRREIPPEEWPDTQHREQVRGYKSGIDFFRDFFAGGAAHFKRLRTTARGAAKFLEELAAVTVV